jgi:hypothetical protein
MRPNKVLKLTLKKIWFDMILSGRKKEEYREIKDYWVNRLTENKSYCQMGDSGYVINERKYDWVKFTNGYNKDSPSVTLKCEGIEISKGDSSIGAIENEYYFVIKLGQEITRSNCK